LLGFVAQSALPFVPDAFGSYRFSLTRNIFGTDDAAKVTAGMTMTSVSPAPLQIRVRVWMNTHFGHAIPGDTGGVNPGDAWEMAIENYTLTDGISGALVQGGFASKNVSSPVHEVVRFPDTYVVVAHPLRDVANTGFSDGEELDRIAWYPIFGIHAIGGPSLPERFLDRIDLKITGPGAANLVSANSPLAPIDGFSALSGIQARRNTKVTGADEGEEDDPLDAGSEDALAFTSADDFDNDDQQINFFWSIPDGFSYDPATQTATVRLNFAGVVGNENARKLSNTSFKKSNTPSDKTRGAKPDFWIGIIPSDSAVFGDSYTITIDTIVISSTPMTESSIFHDTAGAIIGVPTTWQSLVGDGQLLSRLSPPTAAAGLSAVDGNGFRPTLARLQFFVLGDSGLTVNDFRPLANDATQSGFAIYRDADLMPGNGNGTFEAGIDTPIPILVSASLSRYEALPQNSVHSQFSAQNGFRVFMVLDTGLGDSPVSRVPRDNSGINAGSDYFLAIRTSASAASGRSFRIVFGEMEENNKDNVHGFATFETGAADNSFVANDHVFDSAVILRDGRVFRYGNPRAGSGDPAFYRTENNFRTDFLTVGGAVGASYVDQISAPRTVFPGESFAVMGINATEGSGGNLRIVTATVNVIDAGAGSFDTSVDLLPISTIVSSGSPAGGVAFYSDLTDSAIGSLDVTQGDVQAPGTITRQGRDTFIFTFVPTLNVPDDDSGSNLGADFFVIVSMSENLVFGDSFYFRMPDSAILFSDPSIISAPSARVTPLLTAGMPFKMKNILDTPILSADSTPKAVLGFSAKDTTYAAGGSVRLSQVSVDLDDVGNSGFSITSLAALTQDTLSGVALYLDRDGDRRFDFAKDSMGFIRPTSIPTVTLGRRVVIVVDTDVLDTDAGFSSETQAYFYVVLRANSVAGPLIVGHRFTASFPRILPVGSVKFTAPVNVNLTITSASIEIQPAGVEGFFSPKGYGRNDTVTVTIKIAAPTDTWGLRFVNRKTGTVSDTFPANFSFISSNRGDSSVTLNRGIGPTRTGAYGVEMVYFDILGQPQILTFGGDTLFVDSVAATPILDSSVVVSALTTDSAAVIGVTIDLSSGDPDSLALRFGEELSAIRLFREEAGNAFLQVGSGSFTNFAASITATLKSGVNRIHAILTDSFGNVSDTVFLVEIQRNVGNNVIEVRAHPQISDWISPGETVPVLSLNVTSNTAGEVISAITVVVSESVAGAFTFGQNIEKVSFASGYQDTAGVQIYRDLGVRGVFDTSDARIPISAAIVTEGAGVNRARVQLIPQTAISVPANDTDASTLGDDFLIVVIGGNGALFRDSFTIGMPPGGIAFAPGTRSNVTDTVMTDPITTRVPRAITIPDTLSTVSLTVGASFQPIFALNLFDTTRKGVDGAAALSYLDLIFGAGTTADTNIFLLDFAIFRDTNGTGSGAFGSEDSRIDPSVAISSAFSARLTIPGGSPDEIPSLDNATPDSGPDFFLAVKVKTGITSIAVDHTFSIAIPQAGIATSGDEPGGFGSTTRTVTIKAGSIPSNFVNATGESVNYFNPNGPFAPTKFDTIGYAIAFTDTRGFTLRLTRVSTGETFHYNPARNYSAKDTVFVFAGPDTSGWATDEYRITVTDTVSLTPTTDATALVADGKALTPTLPSPPASTTTGTSISVTIRVSEVIENSIQRATSRSERDSFALAFKISSVASGDTYDTAFSALSSSSVDVTRTIPLFSGVNTIRVTLIDRVGNQDSSLTFTVTSGAEVTGNIGFEGNQPIFRYSPSNPTFTFSFPAAVTGGTLEFYNIAGDRLRLITLPAGVTSVDWNAANDAGQTLRNGVYVIKFKVPLADGRTIEESRTIFLLK
jgi:hypothetical protein